MYSAVIVLHGPHIDMDAAECVSRDRCIQAARNVLDSIYALSATTYDPALLPKMAIPLWVCATNILILFHCHALIRDDTDTAAMYASEVEVFM